MNILEEKKRLRAIETYYGRVTAMKMSVRRIYGTTGSLIQDLNALQAKFQEWKRAEPGTLQAELYQAHMGLMPAELNSYIEAIKTAGEDLRAAVEAADQASGGAWCELEQTNEGQ